jgi:type III restriction enzyme
VVKEIFKNAVIACERVSGNSQINRYEYSKSSIGFELKKEFMNQYTTINDITYSELLKELATKLYINIETLNIAFIELKKEKLFDINKNLTTKMIVKIKTEFQEKFIENININEQISYDDVSLNIHPTALTDSEGNLLTKIPANKVGIKSSEGEAPTKYLYDEIYYDSELEKENIESTIAGVVVYMKIPSRSIRIPIIGGGTYSPDFAYVVEYRNGKKRLNVVVETKDKSKLDLSELEKKKIKSAELLFSNAEYDVKFVKQMKKEKIISVLKEVIDGN